MLVRATRLLGPVTSTWCRWFLSVVGMALLPPGVDSLVDGGGGHAMLWHGEGGHPCGSSESVPRYDLIRPYSFLF